MGVGEVSAPSCQRIHVRSDRFRVASEEADPVVEIVDADHQDVGFVRLLAMDFTREEKRKDGNGDCLNGSDCPSAVHDYSSSPEAGMNGMAVLLISDSD